MGNDSLELGVIDLITKAGPVVKFVMILLAFASVVCWAVIISKWRAFKLANAQNTEFLKLFWNSKSLDDIFAKSDTFHYSPAATVFKSGFKELQKLSSTGKKTGDGAPEVDNIHRALIRASTAEVSSMEKNLGFLASTASAAPFVGLFGTVWGIMNSFQQIGASKSANLAVVAPGISEALIATAIGLAAAIPAVVAYNHFVNKIKKIASEVDGFSQDFLNIVQRGILSSRGA
jgi:biopolymer transport protein TolQ